MPRSDDVLTALNAGGSVWSAGVYRDAEMVSPGSPRPASSPWVRWSLEGGAWAEQVLSP